MQDTISSNKIKENKYKILRMSLLLGNSDDKEDTINNFEDASREIDAMNDEIYLKEAIGICMGTFDKRVQDLVKVYEDPQRKAIGIPDTPYSLMEGNGGCLVMYYDLMSLLNKKQNEWVGIFPGYEIF